MIFRNKYPPGCTIEYDIVSIGWSPAKRTIELFNFPKNDNNLNEQTVVLNVNHELQLHISKIEIYCESGAVLKYEIQISWKYFYKCLRP